MLFNETLFIVEILDAARSPRRSFAALNWVVTAKKSAFVSILAIESKKLLFLTLPNYNVLHTNGGEPLCKTRSILNRLKEA